LDNRTPGDCGFGGNRLMELREQKNILRRQLLEQAAGLEQAYCRRADREITSRLFLLPEYKKAEVLFCFVGTEREIDTRPLILDALKLGKRCLSYNRTKLDETQ
jgi:5-formyltetrahydrofolate cyclo-ligase